jgi:hypothetical protein
MAGMEEQAKKFEIKAVMISLIISAFGFVAALFWRDAIKAFIDEVIPEGQGLSYQFMAAILVTVIAIVVIFVLTKYIASFDFAGKVKKVKGHVDRLDNKVIGRDLTVVKRKTTKKKEEKNSQ